MNPAKQVIEAQHLLEQGLHEAAVDLLAEVLKEFPQDINAHRALARVRFAQGHRDWGYTLLRRASYLEQATAVPASTPGIDRADDDDPDVVFAEQTERALLEDAEEFLEWEHDAPGFADEMSRADRSRPSALDNTNDQPVRERPTLTLTLGDRATRPERASTTGPSIIWKGRPRHTPPPATAPSDAAISITGAIELAPEPVEEALADAGPPEQALQPAPRDTELSEPTSASDDDWGVDSGLDVWSNAAQDDVAVDDSGWDEPDDEPFEDSLPHDEGDFDWAEVDVSFDEEDEDDDFAAVTADELDAPAIAGRVELWRRAEQIALGLLRDAGRLDSRDRARMELHILTRILLEGAAGARRPEISIKVRADRLKQLLQTDVPIDDIAAAHACRQAWAENPDFHIDLGGHQRGDGWTRKEEVRHLLSWGCALNMVHVFGATEADEFQYILYSMFDRWSSSRSLRRQFPIFRRYVYYRLISTGDDLDDQPHWIFDDPDEPAFIERWEDDPVRRVTFRRGLAAHGLLPPYRRTALDPLSLTKLVVEKASEQSEGD